MKKQIYSIELILSFLGFQLDDFFIISFWKTSGEVELQGHKTPELLEKVSNLKNHGFVSTFSEVGNLLILTSKEYNYRITLS